MKQIIKTLTFLLLIVVNVQLSFADDVWDGSTIATGFYSGTGTKDDPYTIYTGSQFAYFYTEMANNERTFEGQYIEVRNDIDMSVRNLNGLKEGYNNNVFKGDFDGCDHKLSIYCYHINSSSQYLFGELYGDVHDIYFAQRIALARIEEGGEIYNCYFDHPWWKTVSTVGGTIANCASGSQYYQNNSKYGGAYGFNTGLLGSCLNCDFDGCVFKSYGGTQAENYGGKVRENNGCLTYEEHNQWVATNSSSSKAYKTWPFTFNPIFPSYNVTITFVDNSGLTNYVSKTITAGNSYTLPIPTEYESEFLGWECNGKTVTNVSPTDNIVCTAIWKHNIKQQPTFLTPNITVSDSRYAKYQWKKTDAPTVYFNTPQYTFETTVDNMVLFFDYSVCATGDRYGSYPGYVEINGEKIIFVASDEDKTYTGTMRYVCPTTGEYKIYTDGATLLNMRIEYPSTNLPDETLTTLPYLYLTPNNRLYYCDIIYKDKVLHSNILDTSMLFEQDGNIYAPVNETDIALLKVGTDAESCTIPQSVAIVGSNAFADCANLKSVTVEAVIPPSIMMGDYDVSSYTLYVPFQSVSTYKSTDGWKNFGNIVAIEDNAPSADDNYISLQPQCVKAGETMMLPVLLKNESVINSIGGVITLPSGMEIEKNAKGKYNFTLNEDRASADDAFFVSSNVQADGSVKFLIVSTDGTDISGNDGAVMYVPVVVDDALEGDYTITIKSVQMSDTDANLINCPDVETTITVEQYMLGDVDDDGQIAPNDITMTIKAYLGDTPAGFMMKAADINENGMVDPADITAIIKLYLECGTSNAPMSNAIKKAAAQGNVDDGVFLSAVTVEPDGECDIELSMDLKRSDYTNLGGIITLPEGFTFALNAKGKPIVAKNNDVLEYHTVSTNLLNDRQLKFFIVSNDLDLIDAGLSKLVSVKIRASETVEVGDFIYTITALQLSDFDANLYNAADAEGTITVRDAVETEVEKFKDDNAYVLSLTVGSVTMDDDSAVAAALHDFEMLSDKAKAVLEEAKALLEALKAQIEDIATDIMTVGTDGVEVKAYNINGQRVDACAKGLLIINGKKVYNGR